MLQVKEENAACSPDLRRQARVARCGRAVMQGFAKYADRVHCSVACLACAGGQEVQGAVERALAARAIPRKPVDSGKGVRIQFGKVYDSKHGLTCHW